MLDGYLAKRGALRHTPAGVPAIDFTIAHDSTQTEAGRQCRVQCAVAAVALGEAATTVGALQPSQPLRVTGFLARRGKDDGQLMMRITGITVIADRRANENQE